MRINYGLRNSEGKDSGNTAYLFLLMRKLVSK